MPHILALNFLSLLLVCEDLKRAAHKFPRSCGPAGKTWYKDQLAQTMGNLLRRLSAVMQVDASLKDKFAKAKERRDYLTHHFFRDHAASILSRSGLDRMIAELEADQALFVEVDEELQLALVPIRQNIGIKDEFIRAEQEKMFARAIRGEPL